MAKIVTSTIITFITALVVVFVTIVSAKEPSVSLNIVKKFKGDILNSCNTHSSKSQDVFFVFERAPTPKAFENQLQTMTRAQRRQAVYDLKKNFAITTQTDILKLLQKRELKAKSLWINNSIFVPKASCQLILEIASRSEIVSVVPNSVVATALPLNPVGGSSEHIRSKNEATEWNIALIGAEAAWNITKGEGVVVGIIDTGVRYTHEAVKSNYRGSADNHDYAWFDPGEFQNDEWWCTPNICSPVECCADYPYDIIGHGTHVTGSAVGSLGIGVAPGATWIAAKGCRDGQCLNYGLTTSAEWTLCPTKLDGSAPDCSKGADIVSNSWGSGGSTDNFYLDYVDAWRLAGIIPVFAAGNSGPRCGTANPPGNYDDVLAIGATGKLDQLTSFSSRGPGPVQSGYSQQKPDFVAPGEDIRSAIGSADDKYDIYDGTSMATPQVTGAIALILSVNPRFSYDDVYDLIKRTAVTRLAAPEGRLETGECEGVPFSAIPSYHYGFGRINVAAAVEAAQKAK